MAEVARKYDFNFFEDNKVKALPKEEGLHVIKGVDQKKLIWEQRLETLSIMLPRAIMITLALVMLIGSLMMKASFTESVTKVHSAEKELAEMVNVHDYLSNEYNQVMNFAQVEESARALGLQKAMPDQIRYIDNLHTENAIVYTYKSPAQKLAENAKSAVNYACDKLGLSPMF